MSNELSLLDNFDKAKALIAEADLVEAIDWVNKAEALKVYATKAKKGLAVQNQCAEIKIRAERRAGTILDVMKKNEGGNPNLLHRATGLPPSYKELGIERTQALRWQLEAKVPEELFQKHVKEVNDDKNELTSTALQKIGSQIAGKDKAQAERMAPKIKRLQEIEEQGIYIGTVWDFSNRANYAGDANFHGNCIPQIVENAVLFYTQKGDIVLDPMAGSGTTLDVCDKLDRNCIAFDIHPTRSDISKADARILSSVGSDSIDYIFIHPPYWKLVRYSKNGETPEDLSGLSYESFLSEMTKIFAECHRVLKPNKVMSMLIGDLVNEGKYYPISINLFNEVAKLMSPIGIAIKTTENSRSQILKGKTVWAELAVTNNLKIEHDYVMHFRKNGN